MKSGKVIQLSTQLKEVFCYSVGPFRWSIANSCGVMIKTLKCAPMAELEKSATNVEQVPKPYALVIDEMAMVRKVRREFYLTNMLTNYSSLLYHQAYARRIDIVFDAYRESSKKNAERGHWKVGRLHINPF